MHDWVFPAWPDWAKTWPLLWASCASLIPLLSLLLPAVFPTASSISYALSFTPYLLCNTTSKKPHVRLTNIKVSRLGCSAAVVQIWTPQVSEKHLVLAAWPFCLPQTELCHLCLWRLAGLAPVAVKASLASRRGTCFSAEILFRHVLVAQCWQVQTFISSQCGLESNWMRSCFRNIFLRFFGKYLLEIDSFFGEQVSSRKLLRSVFPKERLPISTCYFV